MKTRKTPHKITLTRETLRHLESQKIRQAAGGIPSGLNCTGTCIPCTEHCPTLMKTCHHITTC